MRMIKKLRVMPYLMVRYMKSYLSKISSRIKLRITKWRQDPIKIIVGASGTRKSGWIATDKYFFDITNQKSVQSFLGGKQIDALFAEHVVEHLEVEEFTRFLKIFSQVMHPDGIIRLAVPDEMHPSPWYREQMGISGIEPGADDHRAFWNYQSMTEITTSLGFKCQLLEYFDEHGLFHDFPYDEETGGKVMRSSKNYNGRLINDEALRSELFAGLSDPIVEDMKKRGITYTSLVVELRLN